MEKKKSLKANLEKSKTMFLSIGLIISIALLISAFSWQSEKIIEVITTEPITDEDRIAKSWQDDIKPPEIKKETRTDIVKAFISDVINITEDTAEINNVEIDWDWEPPIDIEPIEIYNGPLIFASKMPEPYGGILALRRFIAKHVNYPAIARENGIQGTVYLRFEVTKTGTIGKVELQKGVDPLLDVEAIKVVKKIPKFKPGMNNGAKVNVWFSIPISFKLKGNL